MQPSIKMLSEKKLIGQCLTTSFGNDRTFQLWSGFMPRKKEIRNVVDNNLYSMQVYGLDFDFKSFNPDLSFDKWAAVEVSSANAVPEGMEAFILPGGLYAVFIHKGPATDAPKTFGYIFGTWLPSSEYEIDCRPHFEVLGEKYKNNHPDSEEEVWIPVKKKV